MSELPPPPPPPEVSAPAKPVITEQTGRHVLLIAAEIKAPITSVMAVAKLLAEGGTVPFIARYRKEQTGSLDEVHITTIRDRLAQLTELDARRASILSSLAERNLLTDQLKAAIENAETLARLEDIYQPFRPKRRTKATIARDKGLGPLADFIFQNQDADPKPEAAKFVDAAKEVPDVAAALAGARDIIAEMVSDHTEARTKLRALLLEKGSLRSEVIDKEKPEAAKFRDYWDWSEAAKTAPSHRILAMRRGEKEGFLVFRVLPPEGESAPVLDRLFVTGKGPAAQEVRTAVEDGYRRLLAPSLETEARLELKNRADKEGVRVFADNIRELMLAPALGQKVTLALDPGFRSGCKLVVLDAQGKLIHHDVIHPTAGSTRQLEDAEQTVRLLAFQHKIQAVAIGNGTASRETEAFVKKVGLPKEIPVVMVSESGASVYSASDVAREEFPNHDVTVRGSVSIGRRLQDPLAELVKIDPKAIGVGQYQHDVDQRLLKERLDDTVVSCVNRVGVELNTASKQLLTHVSGLNGSLAESIVKHRETHGPFKSRDELRKVSRLGPKAFEQCAGFLRIRGGAHPLDASAVHPERYPLVERMVADLGCTLEDLLKSDALRKKIKLESYVSESVGLPTLKDILDELSRPGRDPREKFEAFSFQEGVSRMEDLKPGMRLPGIVTNVAAFGAFVDIGVHQDGLVHVSQVSDTFVKDPSEVLKVSQKVQVTVVEVDIPRKRIALSLRTNPEIGGRSGGGSGGGGGGQQGGGQGGRPGGAPRPAPKAANDGFGNLFEQALNKRK